MADWACDYSMANDTGTGLTAWANAKKTLKAVTDLAAAGDTIYVHVGTEQAVTVDTTWTIAAGVRILASNDTANFPPTVLSTAGAITSPTSGVDYIFTGGPFLLSGFRLKPGASTGTSYIAIATGDGSKATLEDCSFDMSGNTGFSYTQFGTTIGESNNSVELIRCTFKFGAAGQYVLPATKTSFIGGSLEAGTTVPTVFLSDARRHGCNISFTGFDFSLMTSGTILGGTPAIPYLVTLSQCKLGSATLSGALTINGREVLLLDCATDDTHYQFAHYAYNGSTTISTSIYADDGAKYDTAGNSHSWIVAGNANTLRANPYISPWITRYNEATSAITPELEILRNDSATAFTDVQVWSEWMLKTAGGSPLATLYSDYGGHLSSGTNQGAGVGLSGWTGESGTAWSGRLECPSVTPAEIGHISARVVVAGNYTVYVDPAIRGT